MNSDCCLSWNVSAPLLMIGTMYIWGQIRAVENWIGQKRLLLGHQEPYGQND